MNQQPNRPMRPTRQVPPQGRPTQSAAPRANAPLPTRRKKRRRLRPAAIAILVVMALLLCALVFLISYGIGYRAEMGRLENEAAAGEGNTESESNVGGADDPTNTTVTPENNETTETEPTPEPKPEPEPDVTFTSLSEIVTYVDSLGIDFKDLASFDMSGYFTSATLKKTEDAGVAYQNETVYIGDSLVLHMGSRSTHPKNMVYGAASINPENACVQKLAKLKNGTEATFAEAMAELQPKRIVITIGTNSMWMDPNVYLQFFSRFVELLKDACPNTELILQSTPPLTAEYEEGKNYPTNEKINRFNMYLAGLATYHDIWFLNSAPGLKNASGTLDAAYDSDGFHISAEGYDVWTDALRTHATTLQ